MSIEEVLSGKSRWMRPPGPPIVWDIVDGVQKLEDGTIRSVKFSIQDVPEDRQEEILEFMEKNFLVDEIVSKCFRAINDLKIIHDHYQLWTYCLQQGMVQAAYLIDSNGLISELVAVNLLYVITKYDETIAFTHLLESLQSDRIITYFQIVAQMKDNLDIFKNINKSLSSFGLSVKRTYQGQKLGLKMLESRNKIGKKYGIEWTYAVFTNRCSQSLAERAGFKTVAIKKYLEMFSMDGQPLLPDIPEPEMKLMIKRLPIL